MAIFKQRVTRPLPTDATIFTRKGKRFAKWKDRRGKQRTAEVTENGKRIATEAATWSVRYRDGEGYVQTVATGCRDKSAAARMLTDLEAIADKVRAGSLTTQDVRIGEHNQTPLSVHIANYIADLKTRGVNADRIKTSETRLNQGADGCGFRWLRDLNADKLRKFLQGLKDIRTGEPVSAATHNWHVTLWVAFGNWLTGVRLEGKRPSMTGERRLSSNPFDGFGKRDEQEDRKRIARALTLDEMRRLLDIAQRRPLEDALTVRRGKNRGKLVAKVPDARRANLIRLGSERALIYKTLILTGLRSNELRTLQGRDLSFGDVPFVHLRASNEKNRKGSRVPLRSDLAAELRQWIQGRDLTEPVFKVPSGLLRILDRDLIAAGIDKIDEREGRVHLHAMRHSTGTHLSAAGVAPRTAQAVMRHSDIALTMNTYTDERLLETSGAVELLPELPIGTLSTTPRTVTRLVTLDEDKTSVTESKSDNLGKIKRLPENCENAKQPCVLQGLSEWAIQNSNLWPLPCENPCDTICISRNVLKNPSVH